MVSQTGRVLPTPKAFPLGGRCPSAHTGSDEGASLYPTFPCRKEGATSCRLNEVFLLPRWASRSPPHPSPSVTASPQGEASGLCSPTRKSAPNQGTYMGLVIAPRPQQCDTTAKTSECQRAGPKKRGAGGGRVLRTLWVVGAVTRPRGAAPRCPACPAGVPISPEKWGKRGPGLRPWTPGFDSRSLSLAGFCGGYF